MDITQFNALAPDQAHALLMACCYCDRWASLVLKERPYQDDAALLQSCLSHWNAMPEADWLAAFGHHAKIGDVNALKDKFSKATKEQGQIKAATDEVLQTLFEANQLYEAQNGFIFIVCATGKSAEEMLSILQTRLGNNRETELINAAEEQAKILTIRLANQFLKTDLT